MSVKAISPEEAITAKQGNIPDYVIEAVNELLTLKYKPNSSIEILQKDILKLAYQKHNEDEPFQNFTDRIYHNNYLDIRPVFEQVGWKVIYDKPSFEEDFEAYFSFKKA